jgi:1,4-dihydroxy-2-naphthoate octaprenyltransferase
VNKLHWVVRLGRRRASYVYTGMIAATFLSIALAVVGGLLPPLALIAMLVIPVGVMGVKTALARYDDIPRLTPANAATVLVHLLTGLLLAAGLAADKLFRG